MKQKSLILPVTVAVAALTFLPAAAPNAGANDPFKVKLAKSQWVSHAVSRLTFGPRPGEVDAVAKYGLDRWIDDQLNPGRIGENQLLLEKLQPLLSLNMTSAQLYHSYPPPQAIKAMAEGSQPMPDEPLLRASVEMQVERYRSRKGADDAKPEEGAKPDPAAVREKLLQVLDEKQIATLRKGTADEKRELLASLEPAKVDALLLALPQPMRRGLMPVANAELRRQIMLLTMPQQVVPYDLNEAKLQRAVYSNRQLAELMSDFWYNHFNVFFDKGADRTLVTSYERDAIRPNVFGNFRTLLGATAKSPAMLFYLDNWESVGPDSMANQNGKKKRGLNENYARELLELHTLGVDGGYTQKDIIEVARCFTGWTIRAPRQGGEFFYNDRVHDKGAKVVLGVTIPAGGGMNDAERVLDIVAAHPSTARFISRKLAMRFVADDPPASLVDRMAKTFQDTHGDIREVMKTMIYAPEFFSKGAFQAKIKTPFEMTVSTARALDANVESAAGIAQRLNELGQPLYRKVEPTGYPVRNSEWMNSSALLGRMNFALAMTQGKLPGVTVTDDRFPSKDPVVLAKTLLAVPLSDSTRQTIAKALESQGEQKANEATVAGLLLGSPEFQRR